MDRSGPRIRANRKNQKALLSLLREIREEAGLRQVDMAKAIRMPQSVVSKYESGERRLDILELRQICDAVGLTLNDFVARLERALKR
jgi:transcriptional regulator with XRE-family HTH domain